MGMDRNREGRKGEERGIYSPRREKEKGKF